MEGEEAEPSEVEKKLESEVEVEGNANEEEEDVIEDLELEKVDREQVCKSDGREKEETEPAEVDKNSFDTRVSCRETCCQ